MTSRPFVLFVDDDQRLRHIVIEFAETAKIAVMLLQPHEYDAIKDAIAQPDLKAVMLDRVFGNGSLLPVMEMVATEVSRATTVPTYIVSGVDIQPDELEEELDQWKIAVGNILEIRGFLKKPLSKELLLGLSDFPKSGRALAAFDQFKSVVSAFDVPARLIDGNRVPLASNKSWEIWGSNHPDPSTHRGGSEFYALDYQKPSDPQLVLYRLAAARFEDGSEVQVAQRLDHLKDEKPITYLNLIWQLLNGMYFARMRFYRYWDVPGTPGVLSLESAFGEPLTEEARFMGYEAWGKEVIDIDQMSAPVDDGQLATLSEYAAPFRPEKLVFKIRSLGIEEGSTFDTPKAYWNALFGLEAGQQFLEIPVLCEPTRESGDVVNAKALIIADRLHRGVVATSSGVDEQIERRIDATEILAKASSLMAHCIALAHSLEREASAERHKAETRAREFLRNNPPEIDDREPFRTFIRLMTREARIASRAELAVACWKRRLSAQADIQAVDIAPGAEGDFAGADQLRGTVLTTDIFPTIEETIRTGLPTYRQDSDLTLANGHVGSFGSLTAHIKCQIALPLNVTGRTVGAIGLFHRKPRRFTIDRLEDVHRLIELSAVMLDSIGGALNRDWEAAQMHEVRTLVMMAVKAFTEPHLDPSEREYKVRWHLENLLDRSRAYERLARQITSSRGADVDPSGVILEQVRLATPFARDCEVQIVTNMFANDTVKLSVEDACLPFVVRTLIDNALHHGEGPTVDLREDIGEGRWRFTVTSFGSMSDEANAVKFMPYALVPGRSRDGSHTGLATARGWVEANGGTLSVENGIYAGEPAVVALLEFPLVNRVK